jgi:hypothetical protein
MSGIGVLFVHIKQYKKNNGKKKLSLAHSPTLIAFPSLSCSLPLLLLLSLSFTPSLLLFLFHSLTLIMQYQIKNNTVRKQRKKTQKFGCLELQVKFIIKKNTKYFYLELYAKFFA